MWHSLEEWRELKAKYEQTLFVDIDDKSIADKADYYAKISNRLGNSLPDNPIQQQLSELVNTFKGAMPIVKALRNEDLTPSHWQDINNLIEGEINLEDPEFTLKALIELDVVQYQEDIQAIAARASGESKLIKDLEEVQKAWREVYFEVMQHKESEMVILTGIDDIYTFLDDKLAIINMTLGNRYAGVVRSKAEVVKQELQKLDACLEQWIALQGSW